MFLLHQLLLGNNLFLLFKLWGLFSGLDFALLLPKDPFNLFSKDKGFQILVFINNSLGQLLLPFLLDIILDH